MFDVISLEYDQNGTLCQKSDVIREKVCQEDEIAHKLNQTLWPDHCIMDTQGANVSAQLKIKDSDIFVRKGFNCQVNFSGFFIIDD